MTGVLAVRDFLWSIVDTWCYIGLRSTAQWFNSYVHCFMFTHDKCSHHLSSYKDIIKLFQTNKKKEESWTVKEAPGRHAAAGGHRERQPSESWAARPQEQAYPLTLDIALQATRTGRKYIPGVYYHKPPCNPQPSSSSKWI